MDFAKFRYVTRVSSGNNPTNNKEGELGPSYIERKLSKMFLSIGYIVVKLIAVLDIYYNMDLFKRKKIYTYSPFESMSGSIMCFTRRTVRIKEIDYEKS